MDSGYNKHSINRQLLVVSGGSGNCFSTSFFGSDIHETSQAYELTLVTVPGPGLWATLEAGGRGHNGGDSLTLLRGEVTSSEVSPGQPREDGIKLGIRLPGDQLLQQVLGQQLLLGLGHVLKHRH